MTVNGSTLHITKSRPKVVRAFLAPLVLMADVGIAAFAWWIVGAMLN
jgi:hypothetical protein